MDEISQIRARIDIIKFISEYLPLKKTGRNFSTLCPFHSEKTPSFIVSPERQIWHCFGCSAGGDVFTFLMKYERLEFAEALKILAQRAGVRLTRFTPDAKTKIKERLYTLNMQASDFFHYLLTRHELGQKAREYLKNRGLTKKTILEFKLGYAPNSWDALLKFLEKKGAKEGEIEASGLVVRGEKGRLYDRFRGRIIFPIRDGRGNILGFSGRVLGESTQAKYINTPETPLFQKRALLYGLDLAREAIKKENEAIMVEGEFDMISSYQAGIKNVVATKGTALTSEQVNLIRRYTENISLCFDKDYAGDAAARRGIEIADSADLNIKVLKLKDFKDPDEAVRKSFGLWQKALKDALPIYDYYLISAQARHDQNSSFGKKKIASEVLPILGKIQNEIIKAHYLKKLAQILALPQEAVTQALTKIAKTSPRSASDTPAAKPTQNLSRQELLEEYYFSLLFKTPASIPETIKKLTLHDFTQLWAGELWRKLSEWKTKDLDFEINQFVQSLPAELVPVADRLYLKPLPLNLEGERILKELERVTLELQKQGLKGKLKKLRQKILEAEEKPASAKAMAGKQKEILLHLRQQFSQLLQKLAKLEQK